MEGLTAELVLGRMVGAVQDVEVRLLRATFALEAHAIPYAVVGEQAASFWVGQVDESAVRNTPAVDILVRRSDLASASAALRQAGFVERFDERNVLFLDGPSAKNRDAVRIHIAHERLRPTDCEPAPDTEPCSVFSSYRVLPLEPLVRMLLSSYRTMDHVLIRDLIGVGQIDETWPDRFPPDLADRLREILADPEG
jgi:hypothetical protein